MNQSIVCLNESNWMVSSVCINVHLGRAYTTEKGYKY